MKSYFSCSWAFYGADPESNGPFAFFIRESNLLLSSYLREEKSSLSLFPKIVLLALSYL